MLRFQEKAVSSQISYIAGTNFGRTAIANVNDKQAPVYCILKQNVKHMVFPCAIGSTYIKSERTYVC